MRPAARTVAAHVAPDDADAICAAVLELCRRIADGAATPRRQLDPIHPGPDPVALALADIYRRTGV